MTDSLVDMLVQGVFPIGDFWFLHDTGTRWLSGQTQGLYAVDHPHGLFWRYPPFCLYPAAFLSMFPLGTAYWLQIAVQLAGLGICYMLLRPKLPVPAVLAGVASAPLAETIGAGQSSGLLLGVISVGCVLWARGYSLAGGLVLGLLGAKPNWGLPFGLFALAIRDWKAAGGMIGMVVMLSVFTLPMGIEPWREFVWMSTQNDTVLAAYPAHKVITLWSVLQAVLPLNGARLVWWGTMLAMLAALYRLVRHSTRLQQLAGITLFTVAGNAYASFYDALVLVFPALVWWRREHRTRGWVVVGGIIGLTWFFAHAANHYRQLLGQGDPAFALTGLLVTCWLLGEGLDAEGEGHTST